MFRKCFAAIIAASLVVGGVFAEEIKGEFKKFADGKVTLMVDGKEKEMKVDDKAMVKIKDKEVALTELVGKMKEGTKVTAIVEKDVVTKMMKEKAKK